MISIKGNRDITILVLALFILAFFVFLFIKPSITGMVVLGTLNVNNLNTGRSININDTIPITFSPGDSQPCAATLELNISSSGNQFYFGRKTLENFISVTQPPSSCMDGKFFTGSLTTITSNVTLVFIDIGNFNSAGEYSFILNFSNETGLIELKPKTFTVSDLLADTTPPQITNVIFVNSNGSTSNFMVNQEINCSASISDNNAFTASYSLWDYANSNIKTGSMPCTSGFCTTSNIKTGKSNLTNWYCTVKAYDSTNHNYKNSSALKMINSPPVLKDEIDNMTIAKNQNDTSLDLDSKFDDPDDQKLNYSVSGNDHIDITIESDGDVIIMPDPDWVGNETVKFKAEDEIGAETESNSVMISVVNIFNCTSNWTCGNWSSCINGLRTRTCVDSLSCYNILTRPNTTENCSSLTATCNAGDACQYDCIGGDTDCSCTVQNGFICSSTQNCTGIGLRHKDSGTCCSVQCTTFVDTQKKSGAGGFFSEQTDKIAIGFGIIAAVVFIITMIVVISGFIQRKQAVIIETAQEERPIVAQKSLEISPVKIKPTNIDKMKEYIEQSLATKVPIRIVKTELEKTGWSAADIDHELNIARLRNYIQIKLNQGIPRAEIEQSLRMKGWSREQIEDASKNTKVRPLI